MSALLAILASWLAGSVPTGYLMTKWLTGLDIREHGSGNPGAANVFRVVGKPAGAVTLGLDILKGLIPVLAVKRLLPGEAGTAILCGLAAIAGHNWTPFLNFKGGKGVATSAGVFLALLPVPTLIALAAFGAGTGLSRTVSVGSIAAAVALPAAAVLRSEPFAYRAAAVVAGIAVIAKHIPNIKRLIEGQEHGIARTKEKN